MKQKLQAAANTTLVLIGIGTALKWGGSAAYAVGLWVGAH